ncbi:hypothetical protein [Streptomyces griseocarneus]|uniref:hypothetical protein n=1 Tax=Streptomyces griseocarneus TaxID=51201 RepID=UPI00167EA814|nr:hypothetical protein [Streptomyces griseocarneus]MBZ6475250.1 hypothetical protein [Streptomyces griseocarneus]
MGTASGTRVVLGHWARSPFGPFSDVMAERADGSRLLLAPTAETAEFIAATYTFDRVRVAPVGVNTTGPVWTVAAGPLDLRFVVGRRGPTGLLLRAVPPAVGSHPAWITVVSPPARLLTGSRTRGTARAGRREFYGAHDLHPVVAVTAAWEGEDLGPLAPVRPPVRFGFASAPTSPALVRVTTTVVAARARRVRRGR